MSTAYAEPTQVMDFPTSTDSRQIQEYRNLSAVRWGMSPAFPINVRDRIVLPDGVTRIEPMTLIPFRNIERKLLKGDDTGARPSEGGVGVQVGGEAQYNVDEKTAYACAEEIRFAYANNNPWGFTVFNALTGIEDIKVVGGILKAVLPRAMPLPEMIEYLQMVSPANIAETEWPDGELTRLGERPMTCAAVADSVREQLLEGALQAQMFAETTLEETDEEIHQKAGGGKGKARADARDKMLAEALSRAVPIARPQALQPTVATAPAVNPQLEQALAVFLEREAAKTTDVEARIDELVESRLTARLEEHFAAMKAVDEPPKKGK